MQPKSSVLLKVLLNRYHPGPPPQAFLKCLPQEDAKEITTVDTASNNPVAALAWPQHAVLQTHYSWLANIIEKMPKSLQPLVIASLSVSQAKGVARLLNVAVASNPPQHIQQFLIDQLYLHWKPQEALPREYLPKSSLADLLSLTKGELIDLIELLAMYDLSDTMRHIVDKKRLKSIYQCLPAQRQQFLRQCLHKKEKIAAPKLDIEKWDGSPEALSSILHRRGMLRFGKALCGQGRHFLWHIVHTLDRGRGNAISQHYLDNEIPGITPLLVQQVLSVINFLKPKSEA